MTIGVHLTGGCALKLIRNLSIGLCLLPPGEAWVRTRLLTLNSMTWIYASDCWTHRTGQAGKYWR